jgi:hypothetical protein
MIKKKTNFLNNKDILEEIRKSKSSFCEFTDTDHYDLIIDEPELYLNEILELIQTEEYIEKAKRNRVAKHYSKTKERIDPNSIDNNTLIFRIMTWEHIPLVQKTTNKSKSQNRPLKDLFEDIKDDFMDLEIPGITDNDDDLSHVKINFNPFQHYRITDTTPLCVGKSHWKGGMANGHFEGYKGKMTNTLGEMFILLCDKIAHKTRWRYYTYLDEMKSHAVMHLSCVGLKFNEVKSDNPFAYYTQVVTIAFNKVAEDERRVQNIRDDLRENAGIDPSMTRQIENDDKKEKKKYSIGIKPKNAKSRIKPLIDNSMKGNN